MLSFNIQKLKEKRSTISVVGYFLITTAVFLLTFFIIGYFWINQEYKSVQRDSDFFQSEYLAIQKQELKYKVQQVKEYLLAEKHSAEQQLRDELRERVYEGYAIAQSLYDTHKDQYSDAEIKGMILAALKNARFNGGRGYYFIVDENNHLMLDASIERTDNRGLPEGRAKMLEELKHLYLTSSEGFISYSLRSPLDDKVRHKYSFAKMFEIYGWTIGTGDYLEFFEEDLKRKVFSRIAQMTFGAKDEGYYFVNSYTGDLYVTNGKYHDGSRNIWEVTDANGAKVVQENSKLAQAHPDGGFSTYVWQKNGSSRVMGK